MNFKNNWGTYTTLSILIILVVSVVGYYNWVFWDREMSSDPKDWGPLGDYFGGMLNPIITGFTLIFIVKTFSQNERLITHSLEEMKETRKETTESKNIQKQLAKLESDNLEASKLLRSESLYIEDITTMREGITSLLNINTINYREQSGNIAFKSFEYIHDKGERIILGTDVHSKSAIVIIKQCLLIGTKLCNEIANSSLLDENENKDKLTNIQKTLSGITLNKLKILAASVQVRPDDVAYSPFDITAVDGIYKDLLQKLNNAISENGLSPIIDYENFRDKNLQTA
ncbi:MAG: hypothetical protein V7785_07890 [Bermanella sp.]